MTVGEKIKKIRTFRGMTQKELGLAVGFEEKGADNRIAQYETNYRVPKRELLDKIAQALRVESQNFYTLRPGCAEDFMRTFFWLDEDSPGRSVDRSGTDRSGFHAHDHLHNCFLRAAESIQEPLQQNAIDRNDEIAQQAIPPLYFLCSFIQTLIFSMR